MSLGSKILGATVSGAKAIANHGPKAAVMAVTWTAQNPGLAACGVVGTAGVVLVAAPSLVVVPVLSSIGFGASGVEAASAAAVIHGGIGNVVAGSPFAIAQSAGAAGSGLAAINGVAQAAGLALTAAGSGGIAWIMSKF
ncbi:uncharacterized protein Z519_08949 [Cladophialophora bantiana CBS 173.52]|uniref:Interferon-induced 6-16 n=1 Tax=Cladophialophora bantiana (strain ATCC 10958 / CBS 173.52 / CDC B-1940 / NIH 8579) TaxID=1442370 RepID=A0A0D2HHP1_CLAB1|nr:uncharacterized protein Z519_08949 [Cladophialophora bantiana CBS 173.52]KIW90305.1 hypothetical protein Z519_08949 [Cladophialophora bantiana CBS 173.52]